MTTIISEKKKLLETMSSSVTRRHLKLQVTFKFNTFKLFTLILLNSSGRPDELMLMNLSSFIFLSVFEVLKSAADPLRSPQTHLDSLQVEVR